LLRDLFGRPARGTLQAAIVRTLPRSISSL
jgi:hypothetical protein